MPRGDRGPQWGPAPIGARKFFIHECVDLYQAGTKKSLRHHGVFDKSDRKVIRVYRWSILQISIANRHITPHCRLLDGYGKSPWAGQNSSRIAHTLQKRPKTADVSCFGRLTMRFSTFAVVRGEMNIDR